MIYFVKSAHSKAIKIGVTDNVQARIAGMQTGSLARLILVGVMPGDERYEALLHVSFAEYRVRGEWFRYEGRLAAFVGLLPNMEASSKKRVPRRREPKPAIEPMGPEFDRYIDKVVYPAIREAVDYVGLHKFALIVNQKRGDIGRALWRRGRYFAIDWVMQLLAMLPREMAIDLARIVLKGMGFELVDDDSGRLVPRMLPLTEDEPGQQLLADTLGGRR